VRAIGRESLSEQRLCFRVVGRNPGFAAERKIQEEWMSYSAIPGID